ncbi:sister chromatid cohesion protein Eso1 [Colletotrichum orchidophilum]|uniref:DNA polymerase eta n=1 Tax=Colletotrichum orchidophilum TaxID=1209926 RepID=A0A1G4BK05_9PEZI|nr:sister chromatid cohesion protein Eso1 [Colletotrichum orchidophilum]OHF01628.1 sister chromatid cohesion protein Eso1 [Colletotrichum orchidophilum]
MSDDSIEFPTEPGIAESQFTQHDLQLLAQSSPESPLRVVALIDYDSFYAQYESVRLGLPPSKPLAVRQWNAIIALNYAAKERGLKRTISAEEACRLCPDIVLQHVPTWREGDDSWRYRTDVLDHLKTDKASLDPYRHMSRRTIQLVRKILPVKPAPTIERAGVDEFYLDLSAQVHQMLTERFPVLESLSNNPEQSLPLPLVDTSLNWKSDKVMSPPHTRDPEFTLDWDDIVLSIGAGIVRNIRKEIQAEMQLTTSAGISHNKMLAKVASRMNKPAGQTIIRRKSIPVIMPTLKATSLSGLGGQLGQRIAKTFGSDGIRDLLQVSLSEMRSELGSDDGQWVFRAIRGEETGPVRPRSEVQSLLAAKTFVPRAENLQQASKWLQIFAADLESRLHDLDLDSEVPRRPKTIAVHHHIRGRFGPTRSKQAPIPPQLEINRNTIFNMLHELLKDLTSHGESWPCLGISVSMSNLDSGMPTTDAGQRITSFFSSSTSTTPRKRNREGDTTIMPADYKRVHVAGQSTDDPESARLATATTSPRAVEGGLEDEQGQHYLCPKCSESVQPQEVLEHLDWHIAVELQNEES